MKKLLSLLTLAAVGGVLALGSAQSKKADVVKTDAATETTVYYAVPSDVVGTCNVRLNVNFKGDGDWWNQYVMEKTLDTLDGKDVYRCTYTDAYDGVGCMQFQLYNGDAFVAQQEPYNTWTAVGNYNGKVYVHNTGWSAYTPNLETYIPMSSEFFTNWTDDAGSFRGVGANCWNGKSLNALGSVMDGCLDHEGWTGTLTSRKWHQTTEWIYFQYGCAQNHLEGQAGDVKLVFKLWASADAATPAYTHDFHNDTFSQTTLLLRNYRIPSAEFAALNGDFYMSVDLVDGRGNDYGANEFGYLHVNQTHEQVSDAQWHYCKNIGEGEAKSADDLRENYYLNGSLRDGFTTGFEEQFDSQILFNKNFMLDGGYDQNGCDRHEDKAISFASFRGWNDGSKMPFNKTGAGFFKGWYGEAAEDTENRGYVSDDRPIYRFLSKPFRLPANGIVSVKMAGTASLHLLDFDGGNGELAFVDCKTFNTEGDEGNIAWTQKNVCTMVRHVINFSKYGGRLVQLAIADISSGGWGAAYFDELCANYSELPGLKVDLVAQYKDTTSYSVFKDVYVSAKEAGGGVDYKNDDGPESDTSPLKKASDFVADYLNLFRNYRSNGNNFCSVHTSEEAKALINRFNGTGENGLNADERDLVIASDDYRRAGATVDNWTTTAPERLSLRDSLIYIADCNDLNISIAGAHSGGNITFLLKETNTTIIIVISLVSVTAIGLFLFARKRKADR